MVTKVFFFSHCSCCYVRLWLYVMAVEVLLATLAADIVAAEVVIATTYVHTFAHASALVVAVILVVYVFVHVPSCYFCRILCRLILY